MGQEIVAMEDEERRIKEFKSLYYELNAKPDSTTKIFNEKVFIGKDDIERLDDLVREKLTLHVSEGEFGVSNVIVSTSKHKTYSFNDFKIFAMQKWAISEYINSVTVSWDFFVNVEGYKRPQRHKLTVKISCGLKPEEVLGLIFSGRLEDIEEIEEKQATIIAQMDFIENRLGQEFINIIGEWVDTLERVYASKNKFILFLKRHRKMVAYYFNYVLFIVVCLLLLIGFNYSIGLRCDDEMTVLSVGNLRYVINYIVLSIVLCLVVFNYGESMAHKIFRKLSEYGDYFIFKITKGDENKYNKIITDDKNSAIKIFTNLVFTLILNVGCSIIASILYSQL